MFAHIICILGKKWLDPESWGTQILMQQVLLETIGSTTLKGVVVEQLKLEYFGNLHCLIPLYSSNYVVKVNIF